MTKVDYTPVIIIGAARSGTNMLRDILSQISNIATWDCDEINPIWRHGNLNHPDDEFSADMASQKINAFIKNEFAKIALSHKAQYVVEKSCANSLRIPFINEVFPLAKYILIYRDGRDTVASAALRWNAPFDLSYTMKKLRYVPFIDIPFYVMRFGLNRIKQLFGNKKQLSFWGVQIRNIESYLERYSLYEVCALQWKECVEKSMLDLASLSPDAIYKIKYEDFVVNPSDELKKILDFISINVSEEKINELVKHVSSRSIGKYKDQLSKDEQNKVFFHIKKTLADLGYL